MIDEIPKDIAQVADFPLALLIRNQASDDRVVDHHVRPLKTLVKKRFIRSIPILIHVENRNLECIVACLLIRDKHRILKERPDQARVRADPRDDRVPPANTSASVVHDARQQRRHVDNRGADHFVIHRMTQRQEGVHDGFEFHLDCTTQTLDNRFVFVGDKGTKHRVIQKVVQGKGTVLADGVFKVALNILRSEVARADTQRSPAVEDLLVRDTDGLVKVRLV